jgi:hypothetical protein
MKSIINAQRSLPNLFPGYFSGGSTKHDHATDYGWPVSLEFDQLYRMYARNGLAAAAADRLSLRTWKTLPEFMETDAPKENKGESDLRQRLEDIRGWQALIETDLRAFVGGYAGAILRVADNKPFNQPVDRVAGGVDGIVEIVPAWRGQIFVKTWNEDTSSENYGRPVMYEFRESAVPNKNAGNNAPQNRTFDLHPDRLLLWSADGTVFARSNLEAGYNSLIDVEKIVGAGGEGFWKNAKSAPVLTADETFDPASMAASLGVSQDMIKEAMSERVEDWQKGFDKLLMLQGIKAETLGVTLPQPNEFFMMAANMFAASVSMPVRVLIGNQTGERASTEDQTDFNQTCMARRERVIVPMLRELLNRLEKWGIIPERDWLIGWESLLDSSPSEKMTRASGMAEINAKSQGAMGDGEPAFSIDEIRAEVGMAPRDEVGVTDE